MPKKIALGHRQGPARRVLAGARGRPPGALIVASVGVALLAAGCGSSSHSNSGGQGPASGVGAAYRFATCMRDHGVANFPEPHVSVSGSKTAVQVVVPASDAAAPAFKAAQKACGSILPAPQNVSPAQQHAREQSLFAFAKCLRAHGIHNFPDPTSQGQLTLAMINAAGIDLHAPDVLPAAKACVGVTHGLITGADVERAINGNQ